MEIERHSVQQGASRISYLQAGPADGPVVLLVHGLLSDATTWEPALVALGEVGVRAVALDLAGHGESDKPPTGYALADFAASISQLLRSLKVGRATICGHSLGGAIAIQFAHHYPRQTAGLVLVSAGGLGRQVHPILRVAALPGARGVLRVAVNRRTARLYATPQLHHRLGLRPEQVTNLTRMGRAIVEPSGRNAFLGALNSVIEPGGQRASLIEMGYLSDALPTLIVWAEQDPIIPVSHAYATHEHLPNSRLELLPGVTHEPHRRNADRFARVVADLVSSY